MHNRCYGESSIILLTHGEDCDESIVILLTSLLLLLHGTLAAYTL